MTKPQPESDQPQQPESDHDDRLAKIEGSITQLQGLVESLTSAIDQRFRNIEGGDTPTDLRDQVAALKARVDKIGLG